MKSKIFHTTKSGLLRLTVLLNDTLQTQIRFHNNISAVIILASFCYVFHIFKQA